MKKDSTSYDIFVFNNEQAKQRQFSVTKRTLQIGVGLAGFSLLALVGMSIMLVRGVVVGSVTSEENMQLMQERERLQADNEILLAATSEAEQRLAEFKETTEKLALMVGMEPEGYEEGIGGPDLFGAPYDDYNRPDLGFLKRGIVTLEERLETLEDAFTTQADLLDATPSILPTRGWLSSGFKYRTDPFTKEKTWHNGLDISAQRGTPIHAPAKGVVSFKGYKGGLGNLLEINHGNGLITRYGHMDKFNVSKGQRVKRGDIIGYVGNTGRSTAPHLHYEIHKDGKALNPMKYVIRDARAL